MRRRRICRVRTQNNSKLITERMRAESKRSMRSGEQMKRKRTIMNEKHKVQFGKPTHRVWAESAGASQYKSNEGTKLRWETCGIGWVYGIVQARYLFSISWWIRQLKLAGDEVDEACASRWVYHLEVCKWWTEVVVACGARSEDCLHATHSTSSLIKILGKAIRVECHVPKNVASNVHTVQNMFGHDHVRINCLKERNMTQNCLYGNGIESFFIDR